MHNTQFLEWILSRFTPQDRATAILGDLLETAQTKGQLWFWLSFIQVLTRAAWRAPAAAVVAYVVGALIFTHFTTGDLASNVLDVRSADPKGQISNVATLMVLMLCFPLSFMAPYGVLRFGLRDTMSRVALPTGIVASVGVWVSILQSGGTGNAVLMRGAVIGCGIALTGIIVAALLLRQWRPVVALSALGCLGAGVTAAVVNAFFMLALHFRWSYDVRWVSVRAGCVFSFMVVAMGYSLLHGLLGRRLRTFVAVAGAIAATGIALANVTDGPEMFIAADVHVSPHRSETEFEQMMQGDRLIMRNATMLNLVSIAYKLEPGYVVGGPSWLEWDRYDITAKEAPGNAPDDRRDMLKTLLIQRFKLVTHTETRPEAAFALTAAKGGIKLKKGDPSIPNKCEAIPQTPTTDAVPYVVVRCVSQTPELLVQDMRQLAGGYVTNPVVDQTGLKGVWDFEIKWTARNQLAKAGADGISFFDALENQLGLELKPTTAPLPVLVVDSANETPSPNSQDLAKLMPPLPPAEFEVATIRPSKPDTPEDGDMRGLEINMQGVTLRELIAIAWDVPESGSTMAGAPKWLGVDKFAILAKAEVNDQAAGVPPQFDQDDLRQMLRTLLAERFKLATHVEDQPMDAYNLVAVSPKMQKADPMSRTGCKKGPGPDGKDPRIANPVLNRLYSCQNVTMTQFAEQLGVIAAGYTKTPVVDATGLQGGWNFTLSWSGVGKLKGGGGEATAESQPAEPNGALSLFDALPRETGLKLEKVRRPVQLLVIDHVDESPTQN